MASWKRSEWQAITVASLTVGYMGYYFCRSNFAVATPLLLADFADQGLDKEVIGRIASAGVYFYMAGKLFNGIVTDFIGGRHVFLFGMAASICATVAFGLGGGVAAFFVFWCANRLVQSMGWGALVKTAAHWFSPKAMGTVVGILCLSYLFGDVAARVVLGTLIDAAGLGWRGVFFAAAIILGAIFAACAYLLREKPEDLGLEAPTASTVNVFGAAGNRGRADNLWSLLLPFLRSPAFLLVCAINFGLTMVRETFNFWAPTYLVEQLALSEGAAAQWSSLFALFGGLSVLSIGFLSDWLTAGKRGLMILVFLIPSMFVLLLLAMAGPATPAWLVLTAIALTGFLTLGPYALQSGAIAVDLGGKQGSSTAAGLADTVGYFGAAVGLSLVGSIAERYSWGTAFAILAGVLGATTVLGAAYWYVQDIRQPAAPLHKVPAES